MTEPPLGQPPDPSIARAPDPSPGRPALDVQPSRWRLLFVVIAAVFVVYPIFALAGTRPKALDVVLAVGAMALFSLTLAGGWFRWDGPLAHQSWLTALIAVAIAAIAVVLIVRLPDAGWLGLFYFAATAASRVWPQRRAQAIIVAIGVTAGLTLLLTGSAITEAAFQGFSVAVVGWLVFLLATVRYTNAALVAAQEEIARLAVTAERDRIARDLHDVLGHSLSLIAIKSELAGRLLPDDPLRAQVEVQDIERAARESLGAVRETVGGYRQPTLAAELAGAQAALAAAGITGRIEAKAGDLPRPVDALLAWAVREGVTNVVRHSRATHCTISTGRQAGEASLAIVDDGAAAGATSGVGAGAGSAGPSDSGGAVDAGSGAVSGSGLRGLAERLAAVGGRLEAGVRPDGGYRLVVRVPLPNEAA
ncbi:MAG TPA: histidine kinase [Candidatus Limnocylindrales bacterium]|nr:histidine kinase [Candidatus Limnocylindrales bacterium]